MIWGIGSPVRRVFACTELLRFLGPRVGKNSQALRNLFRSAWLSVVRGSVFRVATLGANALFVKSDAARWAAVDLVVGFKFCGGCVNAARKGDFGNIWFVFERIVDNFNHAFHRHGFLGDPQAAFRVGGSQFRLEGGPPHLILGRTVTDPLFLVYLQNGGKKRVIFPKNEGVVKVFQHFSGGFLNVIAGENHINTGAYGIFHFQGKCAGVAVQALGFALETVKTMSVLQIQCGDASHNKPPCVVGRPVLEERERRIVLFFGKSDRSLVLFCGFRIAKVNIFFVTKS